MADRNYIMNTPTYIGKDLVLPEDREYLERFMNRYYPNHSTDLDGVIHRGLKANDKSMLDQGYTQEGSGWISKNGGWTAGTWKPYHSLMSEFAKTRKGTLLNEINRKYPDWPEDYRNRVADDVYTKWDARFMYGPQKENKQSTQNVVSGVQGVM